MEQEQRLGWILVVYPDTNLPYMLPQPLQAIFVEFVPNR